MGNVSIIIHHGFILIVIPLILCFILIEAAPRRSLITNLPGFTGTFPSKHYSGYVRIDKHKAQHMFYYYVESQRNPAKDALVLWLNGGPGCSSLGGFVYEHGPFNFQVSSPFKSGEPDKKRDMPKLHLNPNTWSKVSNIIYLDSPVGTGFSFSRNTSDYTTGDFKTAFHTHIFLLKWFNMFPERLSNPFYIAGESYAGVFIPTLASQIIKGLEFQTRTVINLKGYMIGNGVTDNYFDGNAVVPFTYGKGLISDDLYQEIVDACHGTYFNITASRNKCQSKLSDFEQIIQNLDPYNILEECYDFYYDEEYECYSCIGDEELHFDDSGTLKHKEKGRMFAHTFSSTKHGISSTWSSQSTASIGRLCNHDMAPDLWLNNAAVRKAIHAAEKHVSGRWDMCTDRITYHSDAGSMIKYHKRFTSIGLRVLIYSGDDDMVVPYTGSEAWIRSLGYKIVDEWRPWFSNGQVAGFTQDYDKNLTFLTVKGSGHMVPQDKPREALDFYSRWLSSQRI